MKVQERDTPSVKTEVGVDYAGFTSGPARQSSGGFTRQQFGELARVRGGVSP